MRRIGTEQEANPIARWSSDGKSICFVKDEQVWVMDEDGDHAQVLWKPPQGVTDFAVSPDATQLAVTIASRTSRIWLVRSDGKDPHPLNLDWPVDADESNGQWSPDGHHFIFNSEREGRGNSLTTPPPNQIVLHRPVETARIIGNFVGYGCPEGRSFPKRRFSEITESLTTSRLISTDVLV